MDNRTAVTTQPRWRSWALWSSVLGALVIILRAFGVLAAMGVNDETAQTVITALGAILTAFGIVNNPTDSAHL